MKTRRSFFKKLGALVAIVALAPEICFKHNFPNPDPSDKYQKDFVRAFFWGEPMPVEPLNLEELFQQFYAIKKEREAAEARGEPSAIELWMRGTPEEHAVTRKRFQEIFEKYGEGDVI